MTSPKTFVIDTNLMVSALLLKNSVARQAFDKAASEGKFILSVAVVEELNQVLRRKKFNKYITETERLEFLETFISQAILVEISETITACRDPKDNKFLELAVAGNASCIITGDEDLIVLTPFREIPILSPRTFLEQPF